MSHIGKLQSFKIFICVGLEKCDKTKARQIEIILYFRFNFILWFNYFWNNLIVGIKCDCSNIGIKCDLIIISYTYSLKGVLPWIMSICHKSCLFVVAFGVYKLGTSCSKNHFLTRIIFFIFVFLQILKRA